MRRVRRKPFFMLFNESAKMCVCELSRVGWTIKEDFLRRNYNPLFAFKLLLFGFLANPAKFDFLPTVENVVEGVYRLGSASFPSHPITLFTFSLSFFSYYKRQPNISDDSSCQQILLPRHRDVLRAREICTQCSNPFCSLARSLSVNKNSIFRH